MTNNRFYVFLLRNPIVLHFFLFIELLLLIFLLFQTYVITNVGGILVHAQENIRIGLTESEVISLMGTPNIICNSNEDLANTRSYSPRPSELRNNQMKVIIYDSVFLLNGLRTYIYINKEGVIDTVLYSRS